METDKVIGGHLSCRIRLENSSAEQWLEAYVDRDTSREKFDEMCKSFGDMLYHYMETGEKL